ncbi:serine/threonine-protein kinase [Polyangium sp. 6x1]|uniref:serine/threonine protein kinase n=1 Tax=Polyangium sp. 6x1 TaxID=3042689 RepID=UPI002482DDDD|nr:serine/threonine-protein kinase [Polyangium sp. 6x1]MDI1450532.1 serine/threonine-protein kinase [Polyangium sp. 6x1]
MREPVSSMLVTGTLFHDRYRVVRSIKSGGMGAVFEVHDEPTNRRRALKVMHPAVLENSVMRGRFAQEATVTGGIESEHLVQVLDAGVDTATQLPFLVMELLVGEELGGMVKRRGPLPEAEAVLYLSQVALALDKTHAANIVHRDLKPENLFVTTRDDGRHCVKILDFGVAKVAVATTLAHTTAVVGTPLYMAPEQIHGDGGIRASADIYSLAHVAYTLLVGEAYWRPELLQLPSVYALFGKIIAGELPEAPATRAARRGVQLPAGFDEWFRKVGARDPRERPERATTAIGQLADLFRVPLSVPPSAPILPLSELPPPSQAGRRISQRPPMSIPTPRSSRDRLRDDPTPPPSAPAPNSQKARSRFSDAPVTYEPTLRSEVKGVLDQQGLVEILDAEYQFSANTGIPFSVLVFQVQDPPRAEGPRARPFTGLGLERTVGELVHLARALGPAKSTIGRWPSNTIVVVVRASLGITLSPSEARDILAFVGKQLAERDELPEIRGGYSQCWLTDRSGMDALDRARFALKPFKS